MRTLALLLAAVMLTATAKAAEPGFSKKPQAVKKGGAVRISFAVKASCDAEVAVLDARGKVIRHLAAGLLGKSPPVPFKKGLAQEIVWDGKDDGNKPAAGGPFKVRVRLGLGAKFDRIIGWSGQKVDAPRAMAVAKDGTLYLLHGEKLSGHRQTTLVAAYDRGGKYLRQVFPSPGGLPPGKRKAWPHLKLDDGSEVPVIHHVLTRCVHPGAYFGDSDQSNLAVTGDGRLVAVGGAYRSVRAQIKNTDTREGRRLLILGCDGSVPGDLLGPVVVGERVNGKAYIAVSPDGKFAYAAGFGGRGYHGKQPLHNVVYRVKIDGTEKAAPFIGKLNTAGSGKTGLNDPRGLAVDAKGNVYVADFGNKRIAVFGADGKYVGEIPAEGAVEVAVSRKTGAVYARIGARLVKFGGLEDPVRKAQTDFPRVGPAKNKRKTFHMTLDDSGAKPKLWLSTTWWIKHKLERVADGGTSFESDGNPIAAGADKEEPGLPFVMNVAVTGNKLITAMPRSPDGNSTSMAYDAASGKYLGGFRPQKAGGGGEAFGTLYFCGGEMSAGQDGRLYVQTGGFDWPAKKKFNPGTLRRYDADGKALVFGSLGKHFIRKFYHGHHRPAGLFATRAGDVYVAAFPGYRGRDQKHRGLDVHRIGPDGAFKKERLIHVVGATVGGVAVDPAGNIYLGVQVWPKEARLPARFAGKLPAAGRHKHPLKAYHQHGSIVKFPPTGGRIVPDPAGKYIGRAGAYAGEKEWAKAGVAVKFENVLWYRRAGYISINSPREVGCQCENTRFDVDGYGRLFVPDLFRFRVTVMDSAGNEMTGFGGYGNMDNRGPESRRPKPAIPYGWPIGVELVGDRVYVADLNNRRIVVAKLTYAADETCAVK